MATSVYEEAAARIEEGKDPDIPSYMVAADTLSIANGNQTFIESAAEATESVSKFIGLSVMSGVNQLQNIPADVGNFLGGDFERREFETVLENLDSNLGEFYKEHQTGVDLVGFMASSVVPGMGGVKILSAGQAMARTAIQSGRVGGNMAKGLGILAPQRRKLMTQAVEAVSNNSAPASIISANALKSAGSSLWGNVLEAAAFETAVAATMFNSPVLENQDMGDLISNIMWGAGVFGLIGGAIDVTKLNFALKNAAKEATTEARPWQFVPEQAPASTTYEKLALDIDELYAIPAIPDELAESRRIFLQQASETKVKTLNTRIRSNLLSLSEGDTEVAGALYRQFRSASKNESLEGFIGAMETSRLVATSKISKRLDRLAKKVEKQTASQTEIDEYLLSDVATSWTKMWGDNSGPMVTGQRPVVTQLIDTLKKGQQIKVNVSKKTGGGSVTAGKNSYKFDTKYNRGIKVGVGKNAKPAKPYSITTSNVLETNARYIWAAKLPRWTVDPKNKLTVHVDDLPLMEKVLKDIPEEDLKYITFTGFKKGQETVIGSGLQDFIGAQKVEIANRLLKIKGSKRLKAIDEFGETAGERIIQDEIASIVNVKTNFLSGIQKVSPGSTFDASDIFAMQSFAEEYTKKMIDNGSLPANSAPIDIWTVPQHIRFTYKTNAAPETLTFAPDPVSGIPLAGINNHVLENMVIIKEQQKIYQDGTSRAAADAIGIENYNRLQDVNSGMVYNGANPSGAGHGFAASASNNYGTLAGFHEDIGRNTARMIRENRESAREVLQPLLYKLANKTEAAIEFSVLNTRIRAKDIEYGLNEAGDALEPLLIIRHRRALAKAAEAGDELPPQPKLSQTALEEPIIPINNQETRDIIAAHIELNAGRTDKLAAIRTAQGVQFNRSPDAFYPTPVDTRNFKFFAIVKDRSVTGSAHSSTLYAQTADELDGMIRKIKQDPKFEVITKGEAEEYFKSQGQYEYEKTLNSNYIDTYAKRTGVSAPTLTPTDPDKIVGDLLEWHMLRETGLVREAVSAKYEVQFEELRRLGDEVTNVQTSQFSNFSLLEFADEAINNPYADYIKTALAIRKGSNYPWWVKPNQMLDSAVSRVLKKATTAMLRAKTDTEMAEVTAMLDRAGWKGAAYDPSMEIFANARAAGGALTATVQKANSILATIVLRLDTLNAVNNAVSANVLLGAETKAVVRAIHNGDEEAVGALAGLMKIKVPGTDQHMMAPGKMISNAVQKFGRLGKNGPEYAFYKENGYLTSITDQYKQSLEGLSFNGNVKVWRKGIDKVHSKFRAAGDQGERLTGNRLAEEFNRFVAADVMKQMTDIAVSRELMTAKQQLAYINTFVNRTQGNYLAAQRPMMFQGPVGQAIGLFQTYQFNLMQQLLRHVGEGHSKDAMTLLGLQGTIHGMNGLPAFNAVNTHIVGMASGNTEHRDAYDTAYGVLGKEAGNWLMYGVASNLPGLAHPDLKVNLYTRGDINPRHVTIIPTSPAEVPAIQAGARFFANLFNTAGKLKAGGDISTTLLQGLEHNALSRPLAGIAQTLQGFNNINQASYSTSKKGNVISSNDLLTLANLTRMIGGKPMEEAVAIDAAYRFKAYNLKDNKKRQTLGKAIKTTMIAGENPTQEQINDFAQRYAELGGRQEEFAQWFTQLYKTANLSQANKIQQSLSDPFAKSMQEIMGGRELRDFTP